jgi:hypothetical protein
MLEVVDSMLELEENSAWPLAQAISNRIHNEERANLLLALANSGRPGWPGTDRLILALHVRRDLFDPDKLPCWRSTSHDSSKTGERT